MTMQIEDYFEFLGPNEIKIKGHRIWIEHVLEEYLLRDMTFEELVKRFDTLTKEDILAVLLYYHRNKEALDKYMTEHVEYCRRSRAEDELKNAAWHEKMRALLSDRLARKEQQAS
ncbi:MAG: DUF433 domain-containing protein [Gemmataceae bacterium]|nr:DUF433 domain-containing protein [Gemmataceae bacterium]